MADEIKIKAPEVEQNINITVSGEEKLKSFTTTLNRIARDTQLQKYWKDQKSLIKGVIAAYADFKRISNETNATSLINNVNALKAIAGSDISGLFKNFDHISEQIERASSMVGRVVGEYSPENFKEAFSSFEAMRAYGLDMEEVFSRMSKTANVEELNNTISILEGELAKAQSRAASAARELEKVTSGEKFSEMRNELENVSNVLDRVTTQAADEFRAFLTTNDIAEYDMFGDSLYYTYFEGIKNGSMTAKEAIAKFKAEFEYLLDVDASAGIGVEQFNRMSDKMDELLIKIEEVRKHISTISTSPLQAVASGLSENVQLTESQRMAMSNLSAEGNNLSSVFDILKGLISAGDVASDEVSKVHGSLADVLGVLRDIAGIDPTSLNSLGGALRMIGGLHNLNIDKTPLNNLAGALQNIGGMVSTPNLSTLSAVDLHGFSDLKVSKASLSNLASYLPEIAKIDVPSLINLSKVDLSNFNNLKISKSSVEGLSILAQSNSLIEQQAELIGLIKKEREEYTKVLEKQAEAEKKASGGGSGGNGGDSGGSSRSSSGGDQNILTKRATLLKQIETLLIRVQAAQTNWTAASMGGTREAYTALGGYIDRLRVLSSGYESIPETDIRRELSDINAEFTRNSRIIKDAGRNVKSLSDKFGGLAKKFASWLSVSQVIMKLYQALRKMVQVVVDIDTAMTELRKVTNETETAYIKFLDKATERAKKLGTTISDTINATADFARLGYNLDEASTLSDAAVVYKNVGDGIESINDASASIISTMKAFGIEVEDVMSIVDRFNEVGNNFAISSKGVGDALLNSASAMAAANNTLDESIALITAANSVVQNPEKVGTALKTTSMFLRAAKTEAEEAGESTDGMAESVSALREEILALTGNRVEIQIDKNTFKSSYEILRDLSKVWKDLSDITQANILEMIGGKRNSNVVAAILNNFEIAESVMESTANAAGSALAENEKYLQSIRGEISKFKAEFEELAVTLIGAEFAKEVVRFGTGVLSILNSIADLIDKIGGLKTVLSSVVAGGLLFNLGGIGSQFAKLEDRARKLIAVFNRVPAVLRMYKNGTAATLLHTDRFTAALKGLGIAASKTQLAIGGLFAAITLGMMAYQAHKNALEEQRQAAINSAKSYEDAKDSVEGYEDKIRSLRESLESNTISEHEAKEKREELISIQEKLIDLFGDEAEGINLVTGEIEDQIDAIKKLKKEEWENWRQENYSANNNIVDNFVDYTPAHQRAILGFASAGISRDFYEQMEEEVSRAIESGALKAKIGKNYGYDGSLIDMSFLPDTDNIYEAQEVFSELYRIAEKVGKRVFSSEEYESEMDTIFQIFSDQLSSINGIISEEESAFNTLAEGVLSYSDEYKDVWENALEAHERYSKALREDDRQGMNEAIAEMSEARNKLSDAFNKSFKTRDDLAAELYSDRFFDDFFSLVDSSEINVITELKSRFDSGLISVKEFREEVTKLKDNLLSTGGASSEVEEALVALELDKVEKLSQNVKSFVDKLSGASVDPQSLGRSMVDNFGEGNVNLTNRKKVQNEDGSYSTVASEWVNDTVGGKEVAIHFTPILDGEFLDSNDINNYLDILLDGATSSSEILERDRNGLGIVLRVKEDFDFNTENAWGESLHLAQEEFYSAKEAAEELEKYIGDMTFDELKIAEELISSETFDSLDEFETRLNQINFAGAEMVNVFDFSDMFSGMNTAVEGLDNIISAMEALNSGTALTKNQLSSLAMEYPKLLEQANLFTDGSIEGQKNLLNTILESKEAEHDAHIDAKISELNATNEVLKMQIDLENMRKDKVLEIEELMTNGKLDAEADYQKILNDIKDVEGSNFVTFEQGKLNVNKEALEDKLVQEGNSVEESKPIWEEAGNLIVESSYKGVNEGNKAWPKGLEKLRSWYNNKFLPFLENMSTNIKEAWSKEDVTIFDALKKSFSGSVEDIGDGSNVTLTTDIEETYTINGQSVNDWVSNYKETLDKRVEVINKQIEANKITIKNLESLKGLNLTDMYGSSSSVSGSSSGKSDAEKAVEEYQANIDAYYAAEKRLKEIIALHESLEKKLEHTNDLSEKIKITKELIEVYKDEAEAEQDLVEAKIDTIEANARALRKLGFDVIYDSDTNEFFIENLEHLNKLTADSKGKYDSLQEATNALREETEKLIDTTEQLNNDNIEAAGSIEDLGYAVLEAKNSIIDYIEEIYGKQTEAYQKIIDLRKELIESAKDELDYEDEIAEKVKEIADLQTRIDQLSLDDSRSAQAERSTLMKELAEKQKELADTQSEHSTDAQLEALDKMAENFEKEKADEIELLKQTVDTSDEIWSAFYDSILGKNVTIGESINSEIANAWINAANAVKEYSASVGSIGGVGTVVTSVPKYHDGGVVDEANLNKDEALAILQKGKVVLNDGKQQSLYRIIDFQTELSKKLGVALNNTPLFGARPNFGELASRLVDNVQNVSNNVVFEPHIEVVIQGSTNMSESSAKAYGEQIANATIDKLYSAFERRGINSTRGSRLKP